jgi:sn-glycerol 3-phosphate transport system permease protein
MHITSFIVSLFGNDFEAFFAVTSAYAFAFLRFPGKRFVFLVLLTTLTVPAQVTILPNHLTIAGLKWVNPCQTIVIPSASVAYGTFLLHQYYRTLPREIMYAAHVGGASHVRSLTNVFVPNGDQIIGKGPECILVQSEEVATVFAEVHATLETEAEPVIEALQAVEG